MRLVVCDAYDEPHANSMAMRIAVNPEYVKAVQRVRVEGEEWSLIWLDGYGRTLYVNRRFERLTAELQGRDA